ITRGCTALIAGTSWPSLNRDSEEGSATSSVADPSRATPRKRYSKGSQAIREPQPRRLGSRFASDPSDTSSDPGPSPTCSQVLSSRFSGSRPRPVSLCSAGCFASDGGFGVEAFVEVGLEQSAAFAAEGGSAAGW